MRKEFSSKSVEELEVILQKSPPDSGIYQAAKRELERRRFWKKDIISWVSLIFSAAALILHFLKYSKG